MTYEQILGAVGTGGGVFAILLAFFLPLGKQWAERRMKRADREAEVELHGKEAEQKARIAGLEAEHRAKLEFIAAQKKVVENVGEEQTRMANALEVMAGSWVQTEANTRMTHAAITRIERVLVSKFGELPPLDPIVPPPRPPMASAPSQQTAGHAAQPG